MYKSNIRFLGLHCRPLWSIVSMYAFFYTSGIFHSTFDSDRICFIRSFSVICDTLLLFYLHHLPYHFSFVLTPFWFQQYLFLIFSPDLSYSLCSTFNVSRWFIDVYRNLFRFYFHRLSSLASTSFGALFLLHFQTSNVFSSNSCSNLSWLSSP